MFSIKSSFANCSVCDLLDAPSCILETNCENDLTKVDVIFIAENPGKDEVKGKAIKKENIILSIPTPLIGKAGKKFRKYFDKYIKPNFNYLLTNCVLCLTLDEKGNTGNPNDETIELCKENCFKIIEFCNPKLVVLMGTSPMKAFGIAKQGITQLRGNIYKWRNWDVFLTIHPSFMSRSSSWEPKFEEDIISVSKLLGKEITKENDFKPFTLVNSKGIFRYAIPNKYYQPEYKLIDIQFISKTNEVLYIFRDKDNKKIMHKENDDYYCYYCPEDSGIPNKKVVPFDQLQQIKTRYKQKYNLDANRTYNGDMKITNLHAQDYYFTKDKLEGESDFTFQTMFLDIEIYSGESKEFPNAKEAKYPICILTHYLNGKYTSYFLDGVSKRRLTKEEKDRMSDTKFFTSERELLLEWIKDLKELDPDILSGWNSNNFDIPYIYNRCSKIGIPQHSLSKFGDAFVDSEKGIASITGFVCLDQLVLYKNFEEGKKESYSLDSISNFELGVGKLGTSGDFSKLFDEFPEEALKYNLRDVELLHKLDAKLNHISLQGELKKITKTSFNGSLSTMGLVDSLVTSYLKDKNLASKNSEHSEKSEAYVGAFVLEPKMGVHDWIVDFDFTSLYPSIIMTYNIGVNTFEMVLEDPTLAYELMYDRNNLPEKINVIIDPVFTKQKKVLTKEELLKKIVDEKLISSIGGCFYKNHSSELSYYNEILSYLLTTRKEYNKLKFEAITNKNDIKKDFYHTRQLVYKILANSLYGVLGTPHFRFFDINLARTVTLSGQEALKNVIIYGDKFIDLLKKKDINVQNLEKPKMLTKKEIYSELDSDRKLNYVVTGDTDSIFLSYSDLINIFKPENPIEFVDYVSIFVSDFLNQIVVPEILSDRNIDDKKNRLSLKNELVIKRGLFVSKKHYAIYIIQNEGKKVNYIKTMGLDPKRSDVPQLSKKYLSELINIILKEEKISVKRLMSFIKEKESEILHKIKLGDKSIARPISWQKKLTEYKVIPQGVLCMNNWNDLEYVAFDVGSKSYRFLLNGIDIDNAPDKVKQNFKKFTQDTKKLNYIAVPYDEERLPPYYIIDVKKMLSYAWTERWEQILKPILEVKEKSRMKTF